jgi:hypothetical protein
MNDEQTTFGESLGKVEIGFGTLVFVYATLSPMIGRFFPALEPDVLYGLWPVLLLMLGPILVLGGASLLKRWRWPLLAHIPLVLWAGTVWYVLN